MEKRGKMFNKSLAVIVGLGVWAACIFATSNPAQALPSFARQYKVECATCHTQFPERNTFGEAFERNGFIWPGDKKPTMATKGSEGIMLSGIPEGVPLSIFTKIESDWSPDGNTDANLDYSHFGEVEFFGAGNFQEKVGFMAQVVFEDDKAIAESVFLHFKDPMNIPVDIKIGQFRPTTKPNNIRYPAGVHGYAYQKYQTSGNGDYRPRDKHPGIELSKVLPGGHLFAAAGLVNGVRSYNQTEDNVAPYGHLTWRIIGTDLNGNQPNISLDAPESFTDYLTLTLSGWGMRGSQVDTGVEGDFRRYGADAEAIYKKLRLRVSYEDGNEDLTVGGDLDVKLYDSVFEYTVNKDLIVGAAWGMADESGVETQSTWAANASYLYFQNLKLGLGFKYVDLGNDETEENVSFDASFAF